MSVRTELVHYSSGHIILRVLEEYRYTTLPTRDSICLLELHPGHDENDLVGKLITLRIDEAPEYIAVSYVWGDPACVKYLLCPSDDPKNSNGKMCSDHGQKIFDFVRTIPLTQSLNDALRRIRKNLYHHDHVMMLWADAICIDQSNLEERAQQVLLMNEIYKRASSISVRLGTDELNDAQCVFDYINKTCGAAAGLAW
jgi:hypothetical protein